MDISVSSAAKSSVDRRVYLREKDLPFDVVCKTQILEYSGPFPRGAKPRAVFSLSAKCFANPITHSLKEISSDGSTATNNLTLVYSC